MFDGIMKLGGSWPKARRLTLAVASCVFIAGLASDFKTPVIVTSITNAVVDAVEVDSANASGENQSGGLRLFVPDDVETLKREISSEWDGRKGTNIVPNSAPTNFPDGLASMETTQKKTLFFRSILPHILQVNKNIRQRRERLENIAGLLLHGKTLEASDLEFVKSMAVRYKLETDSPDWVDSTPKNLVSELLLRVDEVPPSLVLAQAALESAWGSSRFALEGNNLFGMWVFNATKGMIPRDRPEPSNYSLARYDSITDSVESYFRNLNTLWAYEDFRAIRASMRQGEGNLDPHRLAEGLQSYSVRGDEYIQDVVNLININGLRRFDRAELGNTTMRAPAEAKKDKAALGPIKIGPTDA